MHVQPADVGLVMLQLGVRCHFPVHDTPIVAQGEIRDRANRAADYPEVTRGASRMPASASSLAMRSRNTCFLIFVPDMGHSSTKRT